MGRPGRTVRKDSSPSTILDPIFDLLFFLSYSLQSITSFSLKATVGKLNKTVTWPLSFPATSTNKHKHSLFTRKLCTKIASTVTLILFIFNSLMTVQAEFMSVRVVIDTGFRDVFALIGCFPSGAVGFGLNLANVIRSLNQRHRKLLFHSLVTSG